MDLTGKTIGKYKLTDKLGSGGMAEVYKAFQSGVERDVAIKVMHGHLAAEADFRERFQREARAVGQLQHPNIMRVIDFDEADGDFYMVMEFLSGGTLRDYLTEKKELAVPESLNIIRQLCDALSYAHARGMIHRDIKPGNVMFNDASHTRAILTDFGMARMMNEAKLTVSGAMLGTPAYMPPEVVKGEPADHRADFYSLGAVLYEMVTGRTPHIADTSYAVLMMQVNDPLPLPSEFKPDIDPALEAFLLKSLAKEPEDRFADAQEMLAALDALEGKQASTVAGATVVKKAEPPTVQPKPAAQESGGNNKWLIIGGAIVAIILIALLGIWLVGRGDDDTTAEVVPTTTTEIETVVEDTAVPADPTDIPEPTAEPTTEIVTEAETETAVPTEIPTAEPTPEPVEPLDLTQQAFAVAAIQFSDSDGQQANNFALTLDRIQLPDAETEHVVWLVGEAGEQALGVLPLEGNRSEFTAVIPGNAITDFNTLVISMEPVGAQHDEITGSIIFEQQLSDEFSTPMAALLTDNLVNAEAQLALATQHTGFIRDELAAGNLAGARIHGEHVINILDGIDGTNFGDLNGDDNTENPGDDVGVRVYLEAARDSVNAATAAATMTPFTQTSADKTVQSLENSLALLAEVQNNALKIFAVDTAVEGQPIVDETLALLQQLQNGSDNDGNGVVDALAGEGGITAVYDNGLSWLAQSYVAENGSNAAANSPIGTLHFAPDALTLTIYNVPLPPTDTAYHAWLVNETGSTDLGALTVANNQIRAAFPANENTFAQNEELVITLGSDAADTAVYTASLPQESRTALVNLLAVDTGIITNLTAQTQLAVDHAGFMLDALAAGDLASGKVHAEHVINILVGEAAAEFGDLDGNGRAENPGDGVGVRVYLQQVAEQLALVELDSVEREFYAALISAAIDNSLAQIDEIVNNTGKVLAADTAEEALVTAEEIQPQTAALLSGIDKNENGVADPLTGEGGVHAMRGLVTALGYWTVVEQ